MNALAVTLLVAVAQVDGGPPPGLACLPQWYDGEVTHHADAGWGLTLDGGLFLPWAADDAGTVAAPLERLYAVPYFAGPVTPVDTSDAGPIDDPGRFRVEQLFTATYGATRSDVEAQLGRVRLFGWRYPFHRRAVDAMARVATALETVVASHPEWRPLVRPIGGTWSWRTISRSKNLSAHAWGIAIDLNPEWGHYWRWTRRGEPLVWRNRIPQAVVEAFEAEGFIWGGRWVHFDTMHFEYRPELLSASCRASAQGAPPVSGARGAE